MQDDLFDETIENIEALPSTDPQYVYVMYAEGTRWIKIGHAGDVEARRCQLQIGCPPPLRLLFATSCCECPALEQLLQAHFAPYKLQGEWFALQMISLPCLISSPLFFSITSHNRPRLRSCSRSL